MVVNRSHTSLHHAHIRDLLTFLRKDDVLVVNNTKVFRARLYGTISGYDKPVELFLVRPEGDGRWRALGKPGKKLTPGVTLTIAPDFVAHVTKQCKDGTLIVLFAIPDEDVIAKANRFGWVPVPPYIKTIPNDSDYQTAYAKCVGSVAAPTAGFHLTQNLLGALKAKGITILEITLHVGLGTFLPIKSNTIDHHVMHSEWVEVKPEVANEIQHAKANGRRVVAVGTTTVRALEGVAALFDGKLQPYAGDIDLFITPGFDFRVVDAMLTNFHLPKSTLLVLVCAFGGRDRILKAYTEAIRRQYRFYSFGDAMLIT